MALSRPGPQPKGGRRVPVRFPTDHLRIYEEQARKHGMSLSDYLANCVAREHDLPEPWPRANQPRLALDVAEAA